MKLIKPSVELIEQKPGLIGIFQQIERAGRLCYKSEDKITEDSAEKFVNMLIEKKHYAMLEHGTVYLKISIPKKAWFKAVVDKYYSNPYSKANNTFDDYDYHYFITTNYRVLVENGWLDDLQYICEPTEYHEKRYTLKFTTSIGITRELIRHRHFSFANESTRYCNYFKSKFGSEITFIMPYWFNGLQTNDDKIMLFIDSLKQAEDKYLKLIKGEAIKTKIHGHNDEEYCKVNFDPLKPQEAREILPMCTKSEIIMTGFESDWKHFFKLRCDKAAHPDMQIIANKAKEFFPIHTC